MPVNWVCYLELPVSAEVICSLFPGVIPRSGQTHCCHHPSCSSSSPGHTTLSLSPRSTSSHGLTCLPDVVIVAAFSMLTTFCCLLFAVSPFLFWTVMAGKCILIYFSPPTCVRWYMWWYSDNWEIISPSQCDNKGQGLCWGIVYFLCHINHKRLPRWH